MTIIAAYEDKEAYWIGADSTSFLGDLKYTSTPKITKYKNYYIGDSGSCHIGSVLHYHNKLHNEINSFKDIIKVNEQIIDIVKNESEKIIKVASKYPITESGNIFLLVSKIGIYRIECDYGITKIVDKYDAIGGGRDTAYGALFIAKQLNLKGRLAITNTIKSCIKHNQYCSGKTYIYSLRKEN